METFTHLRRLWPAALLVLGGPLAQGQSLDLPPDRAGIRAQIAADNHATRWGLNWESPRLWSYQPPDRPGRWDLHAELGAADWLAHSGRTPAHDLQLSAIPIFRYWPSADSRVFYEGGVGATVFQHTHFAGKDLSTAFQFGDHLGVGYRLSADQSISLRLSHYSNADLKRPNPGLSTLQLTYTWLM